MDCRSADVRCVCLGGGGWGAVEGVLAAGLRREGAVVER